MRSLAAPRLLIAALALTFGLSGCASGGGGAGGGDGASRGSANRIVASEIVSFQQLDAYEIIQRLRPNWLRSRGTGQVRVVVDNNPQAGGAEALRGYRAGDIEELRYMNASDATMRFGTGYDGGAILITTKR